MLPWSDTLYGVVKNGVLTLSGYSISVREDNGCLLIRDGLKGRTELELRFPRASCPVSRLVVVRSEGYLTLRCRALAARCRCFAGRSRLRRHADLDYDPEGERSRRAAPRPSPTLARNTAGHINCSQSHRRQGDRTNRRSERPR